MTDAEISRRLALAIGWGTSDIYLDALRFGCHVWTGSDRTWKKFDYRDPAVIWPIAERFNAFPFVCEVTNEWVACVGFDFKTEVSSDTAAKAVALAVIKAKEQK